MYLASLSMFAKSSGTEFRAGMRVPTNEYDGQLIPAAACDGLLYCARDVRGGHASAMDA
jgi:hypothetical protein